MFTFFHGTSGFLITFLLTKIGVVEPSAQIFASAFLFSMLPDLDLVSIRTVKDHHKSFFHAPFFWILAGSILSLVNLVTGLRQILHTFFHLFNDYITAVTTGVYAFYPFSQKEYNLFSIEPWPGDFNIGDVDSLQKYIKFYIGHRYLMFYELVVGFGGIAAFFIL